MPYSTLDRQKPVAWMGPTGKPINKQVQVGPGQVTDPTQQLAQAMNPQPMKAPVNPQYGDLAKAMIGQGTSTAPVSGNLEAIARPLEALAGVYLQRKQGDYDTKNADYKHQQLAEALGGITDPAMRARVQQAMEINPALGATMYGQATEPQKGADPFTLGEGQTRFDPTGKAIASVAKPPPDTTAADTATANRLQQHNDSLTNQMRDEFAKQSGNFVTTRDAYRNIEAAAQNPSAAGDVALIYGFMKLLDPGSTVREGEYATAQNTGSAANQVAALYNRVLNGERLTAPQRTDFFTQAQNVMRNQMGNEEQLTTQYADKASLAGIQPEQVLTDYTGHLLEGLKNAAPGGGLPDGFEAVPGQPGMIRSKADPTQVFRKQ